MPSPDARTKTEADYALLRQVGHRLRLARQAADLTPREVGARLGFSPNSVTCWELGRMDCGVATLGRLARLYGVSVGQFFGEREEDRPVTQRDLKVLLARLVGNGVK